MIYVEPENALSVWNMFYDMKIIKHYTYQEETGCKDGRPHLQGYIQFNTPKNAVKSGGGIKSWLLDVIAAAPAAKLWPEESPEDREDIKLQMESFITHTHFEPVIRTQDKAKAYCEKAQCDCKEPCQFKRLAGPWSRGKVVSQGGRTDLESLKDRIKDGATEAEVADEHFSSFLRYPKGVQRAMELLGPKKKQRTMPVCELHVGPPGCGKTWAMTHEYPDAFIKDQSKWWSGYVDQEIVIMNDFEGSTASDALLFKDLLNLMDGMLSTGQTKGSSVVLNIKKIIFTANQEPEYWFDNKLKHVDVVALRGRFKRIYKWAPKEQQEWFKNLNNPRIREPEVLEDYKYNDVDYKHTAANDNPDNVSGVYTAIDEGDMVFPPGGLPSPIYIPNNQEEDFFGFMGVDETLTL